MSASSSSGHAPVDEEDVVALVEQELDERVARAQVEDVGPVDEREDQQDRHRLRARRWSGSGRASSCGASRRRPWASRRSRASSRGQDDVRQLDRRDRGARELGHASAPSPAQALVLRRRADVGAAVRAAWAAAGRLQRPRARSRSRSTSCRTSSSLSSVRAIWRARRVTSAAAREAQVAHHEVDASLRSASAPMTFSVMRTSSAPKLSRDDQVLHGPGGLGLRLVVEALHLVGRTGSVLRHVTSLPGAPQAILNPWRRRSHGRARGDHPSPARAAASSRCASSPSMVGISNPYLSQIERGLREPSDKRPRGDRAQPRRLGRRALRAGGADARTRSPSEPRSAWRSARTRGSPPASARRCSRSTTASCRARGAAPPAPARRLLTAALGRRDGPPARGRRRPRARAGSPSGRRGRRERSSTPARIARPVLAQRLAAHEEAEVAAAGDAPRTISSARRGRRRRRARRPGRRRDVVACRRRAGTAGSAMRPQVDALGRRPRAPARPARCRGTGARRSTGRRRPGCPGCA